MKVLAVDPGITTGIAVVSYDRGSPGTYSRMSARVLHCAAVSDVSKNELEALKSEYPDAYVVAESGPSLGRNASEYMGTLDAMVRDVWPDAKWVLPSQWKGTVAAMKVTVPRGVSQHERDAVRIGAWYIRHLLHKTHVEGAKS